MGDSAAFLLLIVFVLPFFCGVLTGIMVGYVGACFPIIIGVLIKSGLEPHLLPLAIMAIVAGNAGMMISPLHICLAVTLDYFKSGYLAVWRGLLAPLACQVSFGAAWVSLLYFMGVHF